MVKITIYTQKCEQKCPGWKKIDKLTIGGGDDYSGLESTHTTKLRNKKMNKQRVKTRLKKRVKCKVTSKSNKQQAKCNENEQKIKRNGKKVPCNKQKVTSNEQQATSFKYFRRLFLCNCLSSRLVVYTSHPD